MKELLAGSMAARLSAGGNIELRTIHKTDRDRYTIQRGDIVDALQLLNEAAVIEGLADTRLVSANQRLNAVVHERDVLQRKVDDLEHRTRNVEPVIADVGVKCDGCGHLVGVVGAYTDDPIPFVGSKTFNVTIALQSLVNALGWTRTGDKHTCPTCQGK